MGYYKTVSTSWQPISSYLFHDPGCNCDECRAERREPVQEPKLTWFKTPAVRTAVCKRCGIGIYPAGWHVNPYHPMVCESCKRTLEAEGLTTEYLDS